MLKVLEASPPVPQVSEVLAFASVRGSGGGASAEDVDEAGELVLGFAAGGEGAEEGGGAGG